MPGIKRTLVANCAVWLHDRRAALGKQGSMFAWKNAHRYVHWDNYDNEPAMVRYLSRLSSSKGPIQAVFSPITPYVPTKIGSLETFRESYRWFGTESIASVAQKLGGFPLGSLGYLYKLPDVGLDQVLKLQHCHIRLCQPEILEVLLLYALMIQDANEPDICQHPQQHTCADT